MRKWPQNKHGNSISKAETSGYMQFGEMNWGWREEARRRNRGMAVQLNIYNVTC
jgi:hypothetical protein